MDLKEKFIAALLSVMICFAALAHGAHDIWAATIFTFLALVVLLAVIFFYGSPSGEGLPVDFIASSAFVLAVFFLSFKTAANPSESLQSLFDWAAGLALFYAALLIFQRDESLLRFGWPIVPVLAVELVLNIRYKMSGMGGAAAGTFRNPNIQAGFLLLWLPVLMKRTLETKPGESPSRWWWGAGAAFGVLNLLFTGSAFGLICFLLSLAFMNGALSASLFFKRERRKMAAGALVVLILIILSVRFAYRDPITVGRLQTYGPMARLSWWESGWRMFSQHPFLGVGAGNFPSAYLAYKSGSVEHTRFAHSFPVSLAAETGLAGLAAVGLFLFLWMRRLRPVVDEGGLRWSFGLGAGLFLIFSTVNISFEYLVNLSVALIFMGIAAAPTARKKIRLRPLYLALAAALGVTAIPYLASPFLASQRLVSAQEFQTADDGESAKKLYAAALRLNPLLWEAHRGLSFLAFGDFARTEDKAFLDEALAHARNAVELNSLSGVLWWELAKLAEAAGKPEEAAEAFEKAGRFDARLRSRPSA